MAEGQNPQIRNQYLETLGIVQYRPKEISVDSLQVETQVSESPEPKSTDISAVIAAVSNESPQPVTVEASPQSPVSKDLALTCVFWQPNDKLLVATVIDDQLPDQSQISLLKNILRSIDQKVVSLPQFDAVNWPPHPSMAGDESDAREFLSTLINSKLASKPTQTALFLGDLSQQWLLSDSQKDQVINGTVSLSQSVTALLIPSLQTMLNQPEAKRKAWNIISGYLSSLADMS